MYTINKTQAKCGLAFSQDKKWHLNIGIAARNAKGNSSNLNGLLKRYQAVPVAISDVEGALQLLIASVVLRGVLPLQGATT